jgi:Mrp family chromosome partitioning ATPase
MSTLNQAFIKAYQRQSVIPAPHLSFSPGDASANMEATPEGDSLTATSADDAATAPGIAPSDFADDTVSFQTVAAAVAPPVLMAPPQRPASVEPLRAALEVEQFDWPEASESLREAAADQFRAWAAQFTSARTTTLLVTSQQRSEGRTTVLLAAVRYLALNTPGAKVVLVDADFDRPQLAQRLGVAVQIGWEDVFAGNQPLAEALVESTADQVTLLALRDAIPARKVLANSTRLTATLRSLKQHFDYVCLDAGPLADAADMVQSAVFGAETGINAALVVRDLRQSHCEENAIVGRRLAELGVGHWDLVENFTQADA